MNFETYDNGDQPNDEEGVEMADADQADNRETVQINPEVTVQINPEVMESKEAFYDFMTKYPRAMDLSRASMGGRLIATSGTPNTFHINQGVAVLFSEDGAFALPYTDKSRAYLQAGTANGYIEQDESIGVPALDQADRFRRNDAEDQYTFNKFRELIF